MTAEEYLDDKLHGCYLSYTEDGIDIISGIEHSEMCEIMESYHQAKSRWIPVEERLPLAWEEGTWDGLKSDSVVVEGKSGKRYLAYLMSGWLDGSEFNDWYSSENDYAITESIVRFLEIPVL